MLIRCERCHALFSLQDGAVAGAASFRVECGRCQAVFEATAPAQKEAPREQTPVTPAPQAPAPGALERQARMDELARALRPRRPGSEEPPPPAQQGRPVWVVALIGLVLLVFAGFVTKAKLGGLPPEARARVERAREKLLRDDTSSLEQATRLFTEAARLAPGEAAPEAERAFALLLQGATHQDLAARLEVAAKDPSRASEADKLSREREQHARIATRRLQEGLAAAKAALEEDAAEPVALRALALHAAISGAADKGLQPLEKAAKRAPADPWIAYTRAALALAGPPAREKQDRALAALEEARQAEPRMLRAQVEAAAIAVDRQEPGPARAVLARVLQENPQHERAQRLLSLIPPAP